MKNVEKYLADNVIKITALRDPYYELAMRLFVFNQHIKRHFQFLSERDKIIFQPAVEYFSDFQLLDEVLLKKKLYRAPKDVIGILESPFCFQLVAKNPSDVIRRDDLSIALDTLSQFTCVQPNDLAETYGEDISAILGLPQQYLNTKPPFPQIIRLSEMLKEIDIVEHLLERDLILMHFVKSSFDKANS